jgi:hypothetical protein
MLSKFWQRNQNKQHYDFTKIDEEPLIHRNRHMI